MNMPRATSEVLKRVPTASHYGLEYLLNGRSFSYAHQIHTVAMASPEHVLEVGVGATIVADVLRRAGIRVTTLDVESSLRPNVIGSVTAIPLADDCVEGAMCCQVLEHLPFEHFTVALRELRRVSQRFLVLSLPDASRHWGITLALPKVGRRSIHFSPRTLRRPLIPPERLEHMGHHWEIGFRGYSMARVAMAVRDAGWKVKRTWRVPELPWHRFFECV